MTELEYKFNINESNKLIREKFLWSEGDIYDEQCGTVYITQQGMLVFLCAHCPNRYAHFRRYRAHLKLKHYSKKLFEESTIKELPTDGSGYGSMDMKHVQQKQLEDDSTYIGCDVEFPIIPAIFWAEEETPIDVVLAKTQTDTVEYPIEITNTKVEPQLEVQKKETILVEELKLFQQPIAGDALNREQQLGSNAANLNEEKCQTKDRDEREDKQLSNIDAKSKKTKYYKADKIKGQPNTDTLQGPPYPCEVCDKDFTTEKGFKIHQRRLHGADNEMLDETMRKKCDKCSRTFKTNAILKVHCCKRKERVKNVDPFIMFQSATTKKEQHKKNTAGIMDEDGTLLVACKFCEHTTRTINAMYKHMCLNHEECYVGTKYTCEICGEVLLSKRGLGIHTQRLHRPRQRKQQVKGIDGSMVTEEMEVHDGCSRTEISIDHRLMADEQTSGVDELAFNKQSGVDELAPKGETAVDELTSNEQTAVNELALNEQQTTMAFTTHTEQTQPITDNAIWQALPKIFKCDKCDKHFSRQRFLLQHSIIHSEERRYKCHICERGFKDKTNCLAHIRRIHAVERTKTCTYCAKKFYTNAELIIHSRMHTGVKAYICPHCGITFKHSCELSAHVKKQHEMRRDFKCQTCDKAFAVKADLRWHTMVHTGERPHACNVCSKRFRRKSKLGEHMKLHQNALEHKCAHCAMAYNTKPALKLHMKAKH